MKKFYFVAFFLAFVFTMNAQNATIIKYKSSFLVNFIRYIGWPDESMSGDFVIGVLKNKAVADQLKTQTAGKKFGYQNIVVKEFKSVEEVSNCQMLFVSSMVNYSKNAAEIASRLNNKHSLIVTERDGAASDGAMINFVVVDNKLKFEVSPSNAEKFGLKLSNSLLSMSNAIKV